MHSSRMRTARSLAYGGWADRPPPTDPWTQTLPPVRDPSLWTETPRQTPLDRAPPDRAPPPQTETPIPLDRDPLPLWTDKHM